jgi:dienelactone hydrolase
MWRQALSPDGINLLHSLPSPGTLSSPSQAQFGPTIYTPGAWIPTLSMNSHALSMGVFQNAPSLRLSSSTTPLSTKERFQPGSINPKLMGMDPGRSLCMSMAARKPSSRPVLAPNVRGSTGYGKAYSHLDDVEKRMDSVSDLSHAAQWLKEQPDIDGDKLVIYGGSYGGFMVLAAMTHYPDLWAAGVDLMGISNLVTFLENTSLYRRAHREAEYGRLEGDREYLDGIAPINHIDKIVAPLMVVHGANDPRVPLSEAEQLVESLKDRGIPVEFLVLEDEGHGIVKFANKKIAYTAIVAFLEKYVVHKQSSS